MNPEQEADTPNTVGGLMAFIVAAISAAVSIAAIMTWRYMARQQLDLEGGAAFSANLVPLLMTFSGMILGVFAMLIFVIFLPWGEKRPLRSFSFYHAVALLMLTPSIYLLVMFWR